MYQKEEKTGNRKTKGKKEKERLKIERKLQG